MLQLRDISKQYITGSLTQTALDHVSLNLRDSEFVAILGPSGSGKTTLLNIIGGLDRYDQGDLIINHTSTRQYSDKDWDSYRNHTIGFVFQSYNLIPHQSVLSNVELALTISGIPRGERRRRAEEALASVGLKDQMHKRPNQLSGGQMQRVAIARALVNNPDILLADEPTGALDSDTSLQIMELLRQVARDRLVLMVTHNPDLARDYATRIVSLRDGRITGDTNPFEPEGDTQKTDSRNMGRSSMSFRTALSLSFNNLRTKKARTILTAFAGSIGIIGIALILALSTGVNNYIGDIQKTTMTAYPISLQARAMDLNALLQVDEENDGLSHPMDGVYANIRPLRSASAMTSSIHTNNLTAFKKYLEDPASGIQAHLGENGAVYGYEVPFSVYARDPENVWINTDSMAALASSTSSSGMVDLMRSMSGQSQTHAYFEELLPGRGSSLVSSAVTDNYDLLYGTWPSSHDEVVLILTRRHEINALLLYSLGFLPQREYQNLIRAMQSATPFDVQEHSWSYEEACAKTFYLLPACDLYQLQENGTYARISGDPSQVLDLEKAAMPLRISGIICPASGSVLSTTGGVVGYTRALTQYLIDYAASSPVAMAQAATPGINVLTHVPFTVSDNAEKAAAARTYLESMTESDKADLFREYAETMPGVSGTLSMFVTAGESIMSSMVDRYLSSLTDPEDPTLLALYDRFLSGGSYMENMTAFGVISQDAPSSIELYADSFEDKDALSHAIDEYNASVPESDKITYTDYVGLLMSSVTTIVNVISYVLIAFVAVSLVVSSIMIGIITYISVLERTKEIGILRAIGASRRNISQVFNAETFIVGLLAGIFGVGITLAFLFPINAIIHHLADSAKINAYLAPLHGVILIILSVVLTCIGGLIPSRKAARKDPVTALRTE